MTTHILEVAERMADRIGVIAAGRLIAEGTLDELRQQHGGNDASLKTRSSRWSPRERGMRERTRHLSWFARHEIRLGLARMGR